MSQLYLPFLDLVVDIANRICPDSRYSWRGKRTNEPANDDDDNDEYGDSNNNNNDDGNDEVSSKSEATGFSRRDQHIVS